MMVRDEPFPKIYIIKDVYNGLKHVYAIDLFSKRLGNVQKHDQQLIAMSIQIDYSAD